MEDGMEDNTELARLEQFVDKLLVKYNELKEEYHAVKTTLAERDSECAELKDQISDMTSERNHVGERVAGLIGRIEQWESDENIPEITDHEQGGVQGSLFDTESETT